MSRRRGCACGKRSFPSHHHAAKALGLIRRDSKGDADDVPVRAYPCPTGHGWHLTSQVGEPSPARWGAA